jgi:hypothetical protein
MAEPLAKSKKAIEVVAWNLVYSKYALKDAKKLAAAGLKEKAQALLDILEVDPTSNSPAL